MDFHLTSFQFLKASGIKASKVYVRERLESHPNYPALNSLTDLLDEFQLEYYAAEIDDKKRINEIDPPFLAHMLDDKNGEAFKIIKEHPKDEPKSVFINEWSGVFLMLEENQKIDHEEHSAYLKREHTHKLTSGILLLLSITVLTSAGINASSTHQLVYLIFALLGLAFSASIVFYSIGITTSISDTFCNVDDDGCNKVLSSKLAKVAGDIGLADLSGVYFFSLTLFLLLSTSIPETEVLGILSFTYVVAASMSLVSLGYQLKIKSWCKMCLMISLVIWLQLGFLAFQTLPLQSELFGFPSLNSLLLFGMSVLISSCWLLLKPFILDARYSRPQRVKIRKWRQNPQWFAALLPLEKKIDVRKWDDDLTYGNPNGILQILMVSDPYCPACATAHAELDKILYKHREDIGVTIRFRLKNFDRASKKHQAVEQILKACLASNSNMGIHQILSDWFETNDIQKWNTHNKNKLRPPEFYDQLISQSIIWCNQMQIKQTPAFFINGYEMPNPHTFKDLFLFASDFIEILKSQKQSVLVPQ